LYSEVFGLRGESLYSFMFGNRPMIGEISSAARSPGPPQ
jgi:hypothetical protein